MLNKNIAGMLIIGFILELSLGCRSSVKPELLAVPDGILSETLPDSAKKDYLGVINDYAQVEVGDSIPDGSKVDVATDPARIQQEIDSANKKMFIRLPENHDQLEHIYKTLRSASIRIKNDKSGDFKLVYLNLSKLNDLSKYFGFADNQAQEYILSQAKKINNTVSIGHILFIKIDDLDPSVSPEQLLAEFTKPNMIIVSKKSFDTLQLFNSGVESSQFFPSGLNASHMYRIMLSQYERAKNPDLKSQASTIALEAV